MDDLEHALDALRMNTANRQGGTEILAHLAASSKTHVETRSLLANPEALKFLVDVVECSLIDSLATATLALRCIGNACINDEAARSTITGLGFSWAQQCLSNDDEELRWLTAKVLYNICSDHEAAQQQCYLENIHHLLIEICTTPYALHNNEKTLLIDLIFWITGRKSDDPSAQSITLPDDVLLRLLVLPYYHAKTTDLEDFAVLFEVCLTYLRDPAMQTQIIRKRLMPQVWLLFELCENRMARGYADDDPEESKEVLRPLSTSLMWCLSDIAANDAFGREYGLNNEDAFTFHLIRTVKKADEEYFILPEDYFDDSSLGQRLYREASATRQNPETDDSPSGSDRTLAAACQIVGNLLRQLPVSQVADSVIKDAIHEKVWDLIYVPINPPEDDALHSYAGLLVQLTRPSVHVREIIGANGNAEGALERLCGHATPQIKQDGIRLLRALGKECTVNQTRFGALAARVMASGEEPEARGDTPMLNAPS